jgi:ACS family sodium-dependent inorganic phosphate cotransporter
VPTSHPAAAAAAAALPLQGFVGLGAGALADQLLSSRGWSVRSVRVGLQLAGMLGPAACLMAAVSPIVGGSAEAASALITVGLGLSALTLGAVSVNHLDIAPRHAGMVFGAGNTAATLAGLVSVPLTGWVLQRTGSWPIVFGLIGVHFVVGSAVWAAWVGDKPLPEDGPDEGTALPQPSAR